MLLSNIKSFSLDAFYYGASSIISRLVGFLLLPIFTRYLSPEDYGIMTLLGFYTLFYTPLSHLGLQGAMFRYVGFSKTINEENSYLKTAIISTILISSFFSIIAYLFIDTINYILFNSNKYSQLLFLTVLGSFFTSIAQMFYSYLRVKRKVKLIFRLSIVNLFISVSLNLLLIVYFQLGLNGAIYSILISAFISFILVCIFVKVGWDFRINKVKLIQMSKYGLPNVPAYLQAIIMVLFGQYFLGKFFSAEKLGLYAVAWKFCLPLQLIMGILNNAWKAYKFDLFRNNENNNKMVFTYFPMIMIFIYCIIFLIIALWGGEILMLITEESYHVSAKYVPILSLIPLFNAFYLVFGTYVAFGKSQKLQPFIATLGLIFTIIFSIILIPKYSIYGVGFSTAIGWLVMSVCAYFYGQSLFKIDFKLLNLIPFIISIIISGIILNYFFDNFLYKLTILLFNIFLFATLFGGVKKISRLLLNDKT